jgi:kinesin family protein 2/24
VQKIENLRLQREERRRAAEAHKVGREAENRHNEKMGRPGDVDFQRMIDIYRAENVSREGVKALRAADMKICICVRKRPVNPREVRLRDYDSVTCMNPFTVVHSCKLQVDGITKYLDNTDFRFDYSFSEESTTDDVYLSTTAPLVEYIFRKGRSTVFAYGQTGSGKTYTMAGIQRLAAHDVFQFRQTHDLQLNVFFSCFEIYGGRCQDLLNQRKRLNIREDGKGEVQIAGLEEVQCETVEDMLQLVEEGNAERTTHATEVNDESSRSHSICFIVLRDSQTKRMYGKLSLVDLAGSERGADTKCHNRQRRLESAEINKSLLALKECIRALDGETKGKGVSHVPYRASKLTLVLKDSFTLASARTVMIAAVSPCASSADHTTNTLRYADRVKEKSVDSSTAGSSWGQAGSGASPSQAAHMSIDLHNLQPEYGGGGGWRTPQSAVVRPHTMHRRNEQHLRRQHRSTHPTTPRRTRG